MEEYSCKFLAGKLLYYYVNQHCDKFKSMCVIDLLRNHEQVKAKANKPTVETKWNLKNN